MPLSGLIYVGMAAAEGSSVVRSCAYPSHAISFLTYNNNGIRPCYIYRLANAASVGAVRAWKKADRVSGRGVWRVVRRQRGQDLSVFEEFARYFLFLFFDVGGVWLIVRDSDDCYYSRSAEHVCGQELRRGTVSLLGVYDYR